MEYQRAGIAYNLNDDLGVKPFLQVSHDNLWEGTWPEVTVDIDISPLHQQV
jgi:hypothetical protein